MADRIQARAVRRCGQLLRQYNSQGRRTDQLKEGALPKSQEEAAKDAGLSEHQRKSAARVAKVPAGDFEDAIEGEDPATPADKCRRKIQGALLTASVTTASKARKPPD